MVNQFLQTVGVMLIAKNLTVAFAESATAGRVAAEFSLIEDAGKFLQGGIVCYDSKIKEDLLNVAPTLIAAYSAESMQVTKAITHGLVPLIDAAIHIGITGLCTSGGSETATKPVGTMFIYALLKEELLFSERMNFKGTQEEIVLATVHRCAALITEGIHSI